MENISNGDGNWRNGLETIVFLLTSMVHLVENLFLFGVYGYPSCPLQAKDASAFATVYFDLFLVDGPGG